MKNITFDSVLREQVTTFANELGLEVTTTAAQEKNGTISMRDPEANVSYAMYSSGYVRRLYTGYYGPAMYPLNARTNIKVTHKWGDYIRRDYILTDGEGQLTILRKLVPLHRTKTPNTHNPFKIR
jgi:hypothetical protein